jgi:hypothetical protein
MHVLVQFRQVFGGVAQLLDRMLVTIVHIDRFSAADTRSCLKNSLFRGISHWRPVLAANNRFSA